MAMVNPGIRCTKRVSEIRAPIREISTRARELKEKGMKIYPLNIGDPNKFDFETPAHIRQALCDANGAGYYSESEGDPELLKVIASWVNHRHGLGIKLADFLMTSGISEGINFLMDLLLEPGDEALLPGPGFPQYNDSARLRGGTPVVYECDEANGWQPNLDDLRSKITERTRFLLLINPNNPTGAVYERKTVKALVDIAGEHDIPVVADEIYDQLIFSGREHASALSVSRDVPIIYLNGFSKGYLMPGWRAGYMAFHDPAEKFDPEFVEGARKLARLRLAMSTPIMKACVSAYTGPQDHLKDLNRKLKERGEFAYRRLNEIDGVSARKPEGAFYIFPNVRLGKKWKDDREFVLNLLDKTGIAMVPGSGFGQYGEGHFRSVILPPVEVLGEAFDKLEQFMKTGKT